MEEHFQLIKNHRLFSNMKDEEIEYVFKNFEFKIVKYKDGDFILKYDDVQKYTMFILSGSARFEMCNPDGSREIYGWSEQGSLAAFTSSTGVNAVIFDLVSCKDSTVLCLDFNDFVKDDYRLITVQHKLLKNLILLYEENERNYTEHKIILSERTTRKKICRYLDFIQKRTEKICFEIPCTHTELADYLSVDKSSLSRELGSMKKEGLIEFTGNKFEVYESLI